MIIGVPKERKVLEKRVALTPDGAHQLIEHGHRVLIEKGAGEGAHFNDEFYKKVGCEVVSFPKDVWTRAELIVKVKEPHLSEYQYFRDGLLIFDYLHLASMPDVTKALLDGGVTSLGYELVQTYDGRLPLLEPMSEIAGKLSVLNGSYFLLSQHGGRGILPGGAVGVERAHVVIVGAGIAGRSAVELALGLGARVTVLDTNRKKLEELKIRFGNQIDVLFSTPATLERASSKADLLIGAVLIPGAAAPKVITRSILRKMPSGAVFVDISIDQGGCSETSKERTLEDPTYVEEGVIHYAVCNMPSQTARTSTIALTSVTLPYILKLADLDFKEAIKELPELKCSVNTHKHCLVNKQVSEATGFKYVPLDTLL